ncbi:MAG: hypothetical protein ACETWB_08085 [Anaerolineae bacterium]
MTDADVKELLRQGLAAARVGEREEARRYFTQATELDASNEEAWLGLSGVVDSLAEKRACFERVLAINPENEEAQAGLAWLRKKEAEAGDAIEGPEPAASSPWSGEVTGSGTIPESSAGQIKVATPVTESASTTAMTAGEGPLYCVNHPNVETRLRCNRCGSPICPKCAVRTPVGFRCPQCIKSQQALFYSASTWDYPLAAVVSLPLSVGAGLIMNQLGWFFALFLGPLVGGLIAEVVRWATGRRRGRWIWLVVSVCIVIGALLSPLLYVLFLFLSSPEALQHLFLNPTSLLFQVNVVYIVLAVGTAYTRLH